MQLPFRAGPIRSGLPSLLLLLLLWASSASALDASQLKFSGLLQYENYSYFRRFPGASIDARNELMLRPRVEFSPSEKFRGVASLEFREDLSDPSRTRNRLYEAFLDIYLPRWGLTIGRQFIDWGRADTLRPTDLFRRRDYTDLVERREEAILAVKSDIDVGLGNLQLVWAPTFEPDTIPTSSSNRWMVLPRTQGQPPLLATYDVLGQIDPRDDLSSSQIGARLSGQAVGFDFALAYAWTFDRVPTYFESRGLPQVDPVSGTVVATIAPAYRRIHVFGADFATVLARVGIRGEAAYTLTEDRDGTNPLIDDPYLRVVGGLDYTFSLSGDSSLFTILQYAGDFDVPSQSVRNQDSSEDAIRFRHFYRQAALLNSELRLGEFFKIAMKAFVNLEKGDFLLQPEISWVPFDGLSVTAGSDILGGKTDTFFGRFRDNSRARLKLEGRF
jgi:hypothetical protein